MSDAPLEARILADLAKAPPEKLARVTLNFATMADAQARTHRRFLDLLGKLNATLKGGEVSRARELADALVKIELPAGGGNVQALAQAAAEFVRENPNG